MAKRLSGGVWDEDGWWVAGCGCGVWVGSGLIIVGVCDGEDQGGGGWGGHGR